MSKLIEAAEKVVAGEFHSKTDTQRRREIAINHSILERRLLQSREHARVG
jgi:hypothetical protein